MSRLSDTTFPNPFFLAVKMRCITSMGIKIFTIDVAGQCEKFQNCISHFKSLFGLKSCFLTELQLNQVDVRSGDLRVNFHDFGDSSGWAGLGGVCTLLVTSEPGLRSSGAGFWPPEAGVLDGEVSVASDNQAVPLLGTNLDCPFSPYLRSEVAGAGKQAQGSFWPMEAEDIQIWSVPPGS